MDRSTHAKSLTMDARTARVASDDKFHELPTVVTIFTINIL